MPPISRTQVALVLKAKDYALIETYSTELLNALTICNSIFALYLITRWEHCLDVRGRKAPLRLWSALLSSYGGENGNAHWKSILWRVIAYEGSIPSTSTI